MIVNKEFPSKFFLNNQVDTLNKKEDICYQWRYKCREKLREIKLQL